MIRRPPRSTHCISSAASDVYKKQPLPPLRSRCTRSHKVSPPLTWPAPCDRWWELKGLFGSTLSPFRTFPTWKRGLGSYSANPGLQPRSQYLAQAEGLLDLAGFACAADHPPSTRGQGANAGCRPTTRRPGPFHRRGCANRCSGGSRRGSRTPLADGPVSYTHLTLPTICSV